MRHKDGAGDGIRMNSKNTKITKSGRKLMSQQFICSSIEYLYNPPKNNEKLQQEYLRNRWSKTSCWYENIGMCQEADHINCCQELLYKTCLVKKRRWLPAQIAELIVNKIKNGFYNKH